MLGFLSFGLVVIVVGCIGHVGLYFWEMYNFEYFVNLQLESSKLVYMFSLLISSLVHDFTYVCTWSSGE